MKRKAVSLVVICALIVSFAFPTIGFAANDYSYIRVRLVSMGSPTSVTFVVKGAYRIADQPGVDLFPGITYTMSATDAGLQLCFNNGVGDMAVNLPAKVSFKQYANGSSSNYLYVKNTKYGWRYYPGDMLFEHLAGKTYMQMINTVFFETYLYGVVAYEMSNGWPVEALKAQAVCARTYSLRYMKSNYSSAAHIGDTSANQVYKGMPLSSGVPQARIVEAVNGTRGEIITIGAPTNMNLADGVFSASNGGRVRTKSEHWGGANTYHVAKDDAYDKSNPSSPYFTYVIPKNPADLSGLSATDAKKAGTILGLLKTAVAQQLGTPYTADNVTITAINRAYPIEPSPAGSYENTKVRFELNYTVNMTPTPTPTPTPEPTPTPTPEPTPTPSNEEPTPDPSATEQSPDETAVAAGGGAAPDVSATTVDLNYDVGDEVLRTAFASYNSLINTGNMWNLFEDGDDSRFIRITARGYGHGVGLSQRGAQQMANLGLGYKQILEFYYNIDTTDAEYGSVSVTERPLDPIPGNGASALFATLNAETKVRAAASDSSTEVATLPQGGRVELLDTYGDWYRVLYAATGVAGWACAKSGTVIQPDAPSPTPTPAPTLSPVDGKAKVSSSLSMRKSASSRAKTVAKIPKNGQMTVLQVYKTKSWLKVAYNGKTGYVMSKYVTVAGNKSYKAGTVTAKTLTVRSGAGTKYASLGKLKSGETVVVTKTVKVKRVTWYRIQYMGKTGYVEAKYIRKGS